MLVISPDASYVLKPDGSTRTVERPDAADGASERVSKEKRRTTRPRQP